MSPGDVGSGQREAATAPHLNLETKICPSPAPQTHPLIEKSDLPFSQAGFPDCFRMFRTRALRSYDFRAPRFGLLSRV